MKYIGQMIAVEIFVAFFEVMFPVPRDRGPFVPSLADQQAGRSWWRRAAGSASAA